MLSFDPNRTPVAPRDASTVLVVRDAPNGPEVFCVLRSKRSGFLGGAVVFPGGKVDESDHGAAWRPLVTAPHARATAFSEDHDASFAFAIAACREGLEEAGIAPITSADGAPIAGADLEALRAETEGGGLAHAMEKRGLRLDLAALVPFARWVTPEAEAKRFDTRFYVMALPHGQEGRHDERETTMSFWATPSDVLARFEKGEIFLAPPTTRSLELIAHARDVAAVIAIAEGQSLLPLCPSFGMEGDVPFLALPGDPAHSIADRRVDGPSRFALRDGRFLSEDPPPRAS